MSGLPIVYQSELPNQLKLTIEDQSHRYFGDYHRVRLRVRCVIPVTSAAFLSYDDPAAEAAAARQVLGEQVCFEKTLEQMGVPGARLETTRKTLVDQFLQANLTYLTRVDFAARFIAKKRRAEAASSHSGRVLY